MHVAVVSAALLLAVAPPPRPDESLSSHEATLRAAGLKADGPALVAFFRGRTLPPREKARLEALVRQLGADTFTLREEASRELVLAGRKAVPLLRAALGDDDPEIVRRARRCLGELEARPESELVLAAAALIAWRGPAGSADAVLAFLPWLEDETCEEDLFRAVAAVGWRGGRAEPALLAARKGNARQRAAAAWALGRSPRREDRTLAVPLLADADAAVRFRAAEALVAAKDARGVSALVELLGRGPAATALQAEALLTRIAGEKGPTATMGSTDEERRRWHAAWLGWWRDTGGNLDLARLDLDARILGLRMVVALTGYGGNGAVWEYGPDRVTRWQMRNVGGPFDARVLPGGRVLVAEYSSRRVTERDRTGKVLWEHKLTHGPLEVQRLPNGNTFITTNYEILEVTRGGGVTYHRQNKDGGNIFSGQKLPNGHILYGLYTGQMVELDRTGKEVRRVPIERPSGLANLEVLSNGRVLLALYGSNRIVEMDRAGKVVWQVSVAQPTTAVTLPGGNLLVGSHVRNTVREIDRMGKVLYEHKAEGQIFRVRVR